MTRSKRCSTDPNNINWGVVRPQEFEALAKSELTEKEIAAIDMRFLGSMVYSYVFALSKRVNEQLLKPISQWFDDPNWMKRFAVKENDVPNWAEYKRKQRQWTQQQKRLAGERIRLYWQEIRKKRQFRDQVSRLIPRPSFRPSPSLPYRRNLLIPVIEVFSPPEQRKRKTHQQFQHALSLAISDFLPWRLLLQAEIQRNTRLRDLKTYYPENTKKDVASKLIHLLQMETEGKLRLKQLQPFGEITIEPLASRSGGSIAITDHDGRHYEFDWDNLNTDQRNKIITDIKANRVLCKTTAQ